MHSETTRGTAWTSVYHEHLVLLSTFAHAHRAAVQSTTVGAKSPPKDHLSFDITDALVSSLVDYEPPNAIDHRGSPSQSGKENPELLRATLLRYFIDHLARWLDLCDPVKHFGSIVPRRARNCAPLMNAILCSSARHLSTISTKRRPPETLPLPYLSHNVAVDFHNEAIQALIKLASDPSEICDENLLAAVILLRWYEEADAPLRTDDPDSELFLHVINVFITEQFPKTHGSQISPSMSHPEFAARSNNNVIDAYSAAGGSLSPTGTGLPHPLSLRQASYRIALRQGIYACLLKQRPFTIPLLPCSAYRSFAAADDETWANRLVVFCADCAEFCFGSIEVQSGHSSNPSIPTSSVDAVHKRWRYLNYTESLWERMLPQLRTDIFIDSCHYSTAVRSLSRALVSLGLPRDRPPTPRTRPHSPCRSQPYTVQTWAWPPRRAPRTQPHSSKDRQEIMRHGIGNKQIPPAIATACLGIALCGEHFVEMAEQKALVGILNSLEEQHGWPFGKTAERLKEVWGWEIESIIERA